MPISVHILAIVATLVLLELGWLLALRLQDLYTAKREQQVEDWGEGPPTHPGC